MFCGVAMILCSSILPIMYVVDINILKSHDVQWFIEFAMGFVMVSAIIAGIVIVLMDTNKDKRLVQLLLAIHAGQQMMLYGNPIGFPVWLWRRFVQMHRSHG